MLMPLLAALAPLAAPHAWYPAIPVPKTVLEVPFAGDVEEGMVLESAAGLAARATLAGRCRTLVWEQLGNDGYERWYAAYCRDHRPERIAVSLDEVVARLRDLRIVRGYALYRSGPSSSPSGWSHASARLGCGACSTREASPRTSAWPGTAAGSRAGAWGWRTPRRATPGR